jgi:hypothetical protein
MCAALQSRGYPGSMFRMDPFVFKNKYEPMKRASPNLSRVVGFPEKKNVYLTVVSRFCIAAYDAELVSSQVASGVRI